MASLVESLRDPSWWFTVVVAGTVINLVAAFLFRRLDSQIASVSSVWRARSAKRQEERSGRIALLASDSRFRQHWYFYELRCRLRSLSFFIYGLALAAVALSAPNLGPISTVVILLSSVVIVFSLQSFRQAMRALDELHEARKMDGAGADAYSGAL